MGLVDEKPALAKMAAQQELSAALARLEERQALAGVPGPLIYKRGPLESKWGPIVFGANDVLLKRKPKKSLCP